MASISQAKDGKKRFKVSWRDDESQRSRRFATRDEAVVFQAELIKAKAYGAHAAPLEASRQSFEEWSKHWIAVGRRQHWRRTTTIQRLYVLQKWALPYIGRAKLRDLGVTRLKEWRRDILRGGASPKTVNSVSRVVSACLSAAADEGLIPSNPMHSRALRALPTGLQERNPVPPADVERIRDAMPTARDRAIVSLLAYCGLRPGEVMGLQWRDVAERSVTVARSAQYGQIVETKSGGVRVVPLPDVVVDALAVLERGADGDLVFPNTRGGPLLWRNWAARVWRPAVRGMGMDWVPYQCRHTYASMQIEAGRNPVELASYMGHASTKMTLDRYSHLLSARDIAKR
jgi:integrase